MKMVRTGVMCCLMLFTLLGYIAHADTLPNGGSVSNSIAVAGEEDSYIFTANAGDSVFLSVASNISLSMTVYDPNGTSLGSTASTRALNSLTQSGTYTVLVRSATGSGTGSYELHYVKAPGANEHGALNNGAIHSGVLTAGDLDSYTFTANAGDSIFLSVASNISLSMTVYDPSGTSLGSTASTRALNSLTQSGTYTVLVRSATGSGTGSYELTFTGPPQIQQQQIPLPLWSYAVLAIALGWFGHRHRRSV